LSLTASPRPWEAIATLNSTVFGGRSDWRLPNANELQSLANYGTANPAVDPVFNTACPVGCLPTACSCTNNGFYWSSTTNESATAGAWGGFFSNADLHSGSKAVGDFARGVAGGS
jgi:hypothetical protein